MTVKYRTDNSKYVQYRLMSDTFNTTPANWQGVDETPTPGSQNLVTSGGVKESSHKNNKSLLDTINSGVVNPFTISNSEKKYGYYTASATEGGIGDFASSPNLCHIIIPISEFCGYLVSVDYSSQYGFISEYKEGQYIKYCNNCNRVNGTPKGIQIPYDCEYLYLYIGENTDNRIITINNFPSSSFQSINSSISSLNTSYQNLSNELDNVSSDVQDLDERLYGGERPASAAVSSSGEINFIPITLSENGDEL